MSLFRPICSARFLLPAGAVFGGQRLSPAIARRLGQGNWIRDDAPGYRAQLLRHLHMDGDGWPIAALARQQDVGDAADHVWLRADPAWLRAEATGIRLMAVGPALSPDAGDVQALLPALQPLFAEAGFYLDAPTPARWYLRLPADVRLPDFDDPGQVIGADLFDQLVSDDSPQARRWRALASEVQVLLHQHPHNAERIARGQAPINALWFWGAGALPVAPEGDDLVHAWCHAAYGAPDPVLDVLAEAALVGREPLPDAMPPPRPGDELYDLRHLRDLQRLQDDWLSPALALLAKGRLSCLELDFADGRSVVCERWQWRRFWRRPVTQLSA